MYKYFFKKGEKKRSTFIFIKKIVCVWMRVCVHIFTYLKKKKNLNKDNWSIFNLFRKTKPNEKQKRNPDQTFYRPLEREFSNLWSTSGDLEKKTNCHWSTRYLI